MKKYLGLCAISVALLLIVSLIPNFAETSLPVIKTAGLKKQKLEDTILCTGRIVEQERADVKFDYILQIDKVNFKTGDQVKKGDVLFTINQEKTKQLLSEQKNVFSFELPLLSQIPQPYAEVFGQLTRKLKEESEQNRSVNEEIQVPAEYRSPISGTLVQMDVKTGDYTIPSKSFAAVSNFNKLQIQAEVSESLISSISLGQKARISGEGFSGKEFTGKVIKISPSAKQVLKGTIYETVVEVIITIDQPDTDLKPGFSVNAEIITNSRNDSLLVPYEAVMQDEKNREYVFIYDNNRVFKRFIQTQGEYPTGSHVVSGLEEGTQVVLNPIEKLKNGSPVRIKNTESGIS